MSSQEGRSPMDRKTAESLLRGDRTVLRPGDPLGELLSLAKAPATDQELAGETAVMAAFRAAAHSPEPVPTRRRSMLKITLAKLLTVKVAAIAFASTAAVGGVALAASTGALPNPIHEGKPSASASHSAKPKPSGSALPKPSGSALPKIADLCREFNGKDKDHRGQALDDAHFGELVKQAGKKDREHVEKFCARLPKPSGSAFPTPSGSFSPPSTRPSHDAVKPSGAVSEKPKPTASATVEPSGGADKQHG
ncbi:hypothetical protein [Actinoplanes sp. NPDC051851]|uniref:hypothetical protein n=1 Tax=Actinoplanes sp. NPDC051851 TaxID=3154753 RepID=UPI0034450336